MVSNTDFLAVSKIPTALACVKSNPSANKLLSRLSTIDSTIAISLSEYTSELILVVPKTTQLPCSSKDLEKSKLSKASNSVGIALTVLNACRGSTTDLLTVDQKAD